MLFIALIGDANIMGWGSKAIEIRAVDTGHLDGVFMHKRAQKLRFLCERNDKVCLLLCVCVHLFVCVCAHVCTLLAYLLCSPGVLCLHSFVIKFSGVFHGSKQKITPPAVKNIILI